MRLQEESKEIFANFCHRLINHHTCVSSEYAKEVKTYAYFFFQRMAALLIEKIARWLRHSDVVNEKSNAWDDDEFEHIARELKCLCILTMSDDHTQSGGKCLSYYKLDIHFRRLFLYIIGAVCAFFHTKIFWFHFLVALLRWSSIASSSSWNNLRFSLSCFSPAFNDALNRILFFRLFELIKSSFSKPPHFRRVFRCFLSCFLSHTIFSLSDSALEKAENWEEHFRHHRCCRRRRRWISFRYFRSQSRMSRRENWPRLIVWRVEEEKKKIREKKKVWFDLRPWDSLECQLICRRPEINLVASLSRLKESYSVVLCTRVEMIKSNSQLWSFLGFN